MMRDARDHPHMHRLSGRPGTVGHWDTAVWTPVNAWPFCSVCLMVRGSTSTFTTWRFSYEETRGRHPHTLRDERKKRTVSFVSSFLLSKGGKASRNSCASHVGFTSARTLASVTKTTAVHVVLEGMRHPAVSPSAAPSQRKGATHDMSRTVSCVVRCLFAWSRGGCEADGVTEAGDNKHAYHQLQ